MQLEVSSERQRSESTLLPSAQFPLPSALRVLPMAHGISLIEVMFAMGILAVGVLSLVLLIPLGAYELGEAAKLDLGSTLGRAAFRDLEVRGYLQPNLWVDTQAGMVIAPVLYPDPDTTGTLNPTPRQRILVYPYLPSSCYAEFFPPQPYTLGAAPVPTPPRIPSPASESQLYPHPFANSTILGVSTIKMLNPAASYPHYAPPAAFGTPPYSPLPAFAATDSPLLVLDPLMVATAAHNVIGNPATMPAPLDPFTIPDPTILPAAIQASWSNVQTFPYQQTYVPDAPLVPRMTLLSWPLPPFFAPGLGAPPIALAQSPLWPNAWQEGAWTQPRFMPLAIADRIFRSGDDLLFNPRDQSHDRPTAAVFNGTTQYAGGYSWFVTIAPTGSELDENATTDLSKDAVLSPDPSSLTNTSQFTVSVVVCQNRQFDYPPNMASDSRPGEWMVPLLPPANPPQPGQPQGLFPGLGGGDAVLAATSANQSAWLAGLQPGQWLMLTGIVVSAEVRMNQATSPPSPVWWPKFKTIANWYRIAAVDDGSNLSAFGTRNITLQGSDWPQPLNPQPSVNFNMLQSVPIPGVQYANLNFNANPAVVNGGPVYIYATIVEGVVGVFQKTITLDEGSPFTPQQ